MSPRGTRNVRPKEHRPAATPRMVTVPNPSEKGQERMSANTDGGVRTRALGPSPRVFSPFRPALSAESCEEALGATQGWLLENQPPDGYWVGELEGDSILESKYTLLMPYPGREDEPLCAQLARYLY